jgi:SAM-dependent methyltransferase
MAAESPETGEYAGCTVPPELYDLAFGWDPRPEIERLRFLARQAGVPVVGRVLELGCGTGRLLRAWTVSGVQAVGIELSAAMAGFARLHGGGEVTVADMCCFNLGRTFDLIYSSANTIRHVCGDRQIASMWCCTRDHLAPGGVFIADLELGFDAEASKVGRPDRWNLTCEQGVVHACWEVIEPPAERTRCCRVRWEFELRSGATREVWREEFELRTYDGPEFAAFAAAAGLILEGMYELRDPYLVPLPPERAARQARGLSRRLARRVRIPAPPRSRERGILDPLERRRPKGSEIPRSLRSLGMTSGGQSPYPLRGAGRAAG